MHDDALDLCTKAGTTLSRFLIISLLMGGKVLTEKIVRAEKLSGLRFPLARRDQRRLQRRARAKAAGKPAVEDEDEDED